jgi:hypothetical protein
MRPSERWTWRVMGVYRRWSVFLALQFFTLAWWLRPEWFPGGLAGWNYLWSDLAVAVEMIVGICFLGQTMRDGALLRAELREIKELHQELRDYMRNHESPSA